MLFISAEDLAPFADIEAAKANAMIEDAEAQALLAAPCLADADLASAQMAAVKATLRRAILRWNEIGTGAVTQQVSGPFSQSLDTTRSSPKSLFWPSEIEQLQSICRQVSNAGGGAFDIDTAPQSGGAVHDPACSVFFSPWCSCGSVLNGLRSPIFGPLARG